jgi:hypothetical protein
MKKHHVLALCILSGPVATALAQTTPVVAETGRWTTSTGVDYTTGKYGQATSTDVLSVPFVARYEVDRWVFQGSVPYVRVSGPADVVPDLGRIQRGSVRPTSTTQSGLGDVVLSADYALLNNPQSLNLDLIGKVKFGTASRSKGLGTGETDLSLQADVAQSFGDFTPFGTLGYRSFGDPEGLDLRNIFFGTIGATLRVTPPTSIGAALDWREKITADGNEALETSVFVSHRLNDRWKVLGYVVAGLTKASPDFGIGGTISYSF